MEALITFPVVVEFIVAASPLIMALNRELYSRRWKLYLRNASIKFQSLVTPIILIHWQFYYGKSCLEEKSSEKSGTSPSRICHRLCLAKTASDLRKEMLPTRGDLYIRFARRCESSDILDIRTRANGQVRSRFVHYRIFPIKPRHAENM